MFPNILMNVYLAVYSTYCTLTNNYHGEGTNMVDKAGVGEKKWIGQKWLTDETNKQTKHLLKTVKPCNCQYMYCYVLYTAAFHTHILKHLIGAVIDISSM